MNPIRMLNTSFLTTVASLATIICCIHAGALADGYTKDSKWQLPFPGCRFGKYPAIPEVLGVIPLSAARFPGYVVLGGNCTKYSKSGTLFFLDPQKGTPKFAPKIRTRGFPYPIVRTFAALADGGFAVAGSFSSINGTPTISLARLTESGAVDTGFSTTIYQLPNGSDLPLIDRIVELPFGSLFVQGGINYTIAGTEYSRRALFNSRSGESDPWLLNTEAALQTELGATTLEMHDVYVLKNRSFLAMFNFQANEIEYMTIVRFNADGTRDASWTFTPIRTEGERIETGTKQGLSIYFTPTYTYSFRGAQLEQSSGHVLLAYDTNPAPQQLSHHIARLEPDGSLESTFTQDLKYELSDITVRADDSVVFFAYVGFRDSYVLQMNSDASAIKKVRFKKLNKQSRVMGFYPGLSGSDLLLETNTLFDFQVVGVERVTSS